MSKPYFIYVPSAKFPSSPTDFGQFHRDGYYAIEPLNGRLREWAEEEDSSPSTLETQFKAFYACEKNQKPLENTIYIVSGFDEPLNYGSKYRFDEIVE